MSDATPKPAAKEARMRSRRVLERVATSGSSLLVLAIVLMVNYLAFRHYKRFDWTSVGMFTLSDKSVKVMRGLSQDVDIYLFLSQGEPAFENTDELIKRYKAVSDHVKAHYVDPDRQPQEFKMQAQRFGVLGGMTDTGQARADVAAVVAIGEKNWHVSRDDLSGWDMGGADRRDRAGHERPRDQGVRDQGSR